MDCEGWLERLDVVLDGEADPALAAAVEGHLAACASCAERAKLARALRSTLLARAAVETPPTLRGRVAARLDAEDRRSSRGLLGRGILIALAAAGLVALGAVAPGMVSSRPPEVPLGNPAQLSGMLCCLQCQLREAPPPRGLEALLPPLPPDVGAHHGCLHLRDDEQRYWELVPEGPEAALVSDHALKGRRVVVFGTAEPDLHVIVVARIHVE